MRKREGFSLAETMLVLVLLLLFAALTVPSISRALNSWQLNSDARKIAAALTAAKIKAASQSTRCRVGIQVAANSWTFQRFNRTTGTFEVEGSPVFLSEGISGSGIQLKASSSNGPAGFPTTSSDFITFNSRGIPVDATGVPTADNAVYLADGTDNYAVTVSLVGRIELWKSNGGTWAPEH